jgi:hypothetical protein
MVNVDATNTPLKAANNVTPPTYRRMDARQPNIRRSSTPFIYTRIDERRIDERRIDERQHPNIQSCMSQGACTFLTGII